jgi:hypothetical protein
MRGQPPAVNKDTSVEAADMIKPSANAIRERVYDFLEHRGAYGATREELAAGLPPLSGDTIRPRVWELLGNNGFPRRITETATTRPTKSGRNARVLVVI